MRIFPNFRGENKKYIGNHHLEMNLQNCWSSHVYLEQHLLLPVSLKASKQTTSEETSRHSSQEVKKIDHRNGTNYTWVKFEKTHGEVKIPVFGFIFLNPGTKKPWKSNIDTKNIHALEDVSPASKMPKFGIYVKILGGVILL